MVQEAMSEKEIARAMGGKEIARTEPELLSREELQAIQSWEDIAQILDTKGVEVEMADVALGDGFSVLSTDDKAQLVGRPMILIEWRFNQGNMGQFASMRAVVKTGELPTDIRKVIINDGSTGIMQQLKKFTEETGKTTGLIIRHGLKRSDYTWEDDKGVEHPGTTYYIDTSL